LKLELIIFDFQSNNNKEQLAPFFNDCSKFYEKGISAIRLNKTELFHVFFIYQEIFIRK